MEALVQYVDQLPVVIKTANLESNHQVKTAVMATEQLEEEVEKQAKLLQDVTDDLAVMNELRESQRTECERTRVEMKRAAEDLAATKMRLNHAILQRYNGCYDDYLTRVLDLVQALHIQWSESLEMLTQKYGHTDRDACQLLLTVLMKTNEICASIGHDDVVQMHDVVTRFFGKDDVAMETITDMLESRRSLIRSIHMRSVSTIMEEHNQAMFTEDEIYCISAYFPSCIGTCLAMTLLTPPVYLDSNSHQNEEFNRELQAARVSSGNQVDYVGFPALLSNGNVVRRGLVTCKLVQDTKLTSFE